jgi:protein-S-isoprenylcysteine O-methyltransferase Ste14
MSSQVELLNELKSVSIADINSPVTNTGPVILKRSHIVTLAGFLFGAGTQLLFLWTAVQLFLFLRYGGHSARSFSPIGDGCWAMFFALPHSILLLPSVNKRLRRHLPSELLGCVHCIATCVSLLVLFEMWTTSSNSIWRLDGALEAVMLVGFYGFWIALIYSLYLTGMGYQTGMLPWLCWMRGVRPPIRKFEPQSLYRWMRHPVYLSFLGLIWFTPNMTLDHAVLTIVWTAYIYVGSYLKDKRLERFIGQPYRDYSRQVAGFPIIGFGPWGRRSS